MPGYYPGVSACNQSKKPEKSTVEAEATQRKKPGEEAGPERGYAAAFEDRRRDHTPRNVGSLLKPERVKTQILF